MNKNIYLLPAFFLLLPACTSTGANYQPIVDGPIGYAFSSDLSQCKQLAEKRKYFNDDVKTQAVAGAVLGGVIGAIEEDNSEGVVAGAIAGGLIGAGARAWETKDERKKIVLNCMSGRGHKVVG